MRASNWESLLAAYLDAARRTPFAWGTHDCGTWCAGWVLLCTGTDHLARWRGCYSSRRGALREMTARGFDAVEEVASHHLDEKPVTLAARGDLLLHPSGALGICNGLMGHFPAEHGLIVEETLACPRAWAV